MLLRMINCQWEIQRLILNFNRSKFFPFLQLWRKEREIGMLALDSDINLGHLVSHSSVNPFLCRAIRDTAIQVQNPDEGEGLLIVSSYAIIESFELAFWRRNAWGTKARDEAKDIRAEWEERNAGKRTNEIVTIEPYVSNIRNMMRSV